MRQFVGKEPATDDVRLPIQLVLGRFSFHTFCRGEVNSARGRGFVGSPGRVRRTYQKKSVAAEIEKLGTWMGVAGLGPSCPLVGCQGWTNLSQSGVRDGEAAEKALMWDE